MTNATVNSSEPIQKDNRSLFSSDLSGTSWVTNPVLTNATEIDHPWIQASRAFTFNLLVLSSSLCLGIFVWILTRSQKRSSLRISHGAVLLLWSTCFGAFVAWRSSTGDIYATWVLRLTEPESFTVIFDLSVPWLLMNSAYTVPSHLLSWKVILNVIAYAIGAIIIPAIIVGLTFKALSDEIVERNENGMPVADYYLDITMIGLCGLMGGSITTGYDLDYSGRAGEVILFLEIEFLVIASFGGVTHTVFREAVIPHGKPLVLLLNLAAVPLMLTIGEFAMFVMHSLQPSLVRDGLIFICVTYGVYFGATVGHFSGILSLVVLGLYFSKCRVIVHVGSLELISNFSKMLYLVATFTTYFISGMTVGSMLFEEPKLFDEAGFVLLIAFSCFMLRSVAVVLGYTIQRIRRKQSNTVYVEIMKAVGNISGPLALAFGLRYLAGTSEYLQGMATETKRRFFYLTGITFCSLLGKASIFSFMVYFLNLELIERKAEHLSLLKKKLMEVKRQEIIHISQDRLLAEARWDMIEDAYYEMGGRYQDDRKNISIFRGPMTRIIDGAPKRPSQMNIEATMIRRVQVAILQAQVSSYLRQHQEGQLSAWATKLLTSITEDRVSFSESIVPVEYLATYTSLSPMWRRIQEAFQRMVIVLRIHDESGSPKPPRGRIRRFLFNMDRSMRYEVFVHLVLLSHMMMSFVELKFYIPFPKKLLIPIGFSVANKVFYSFYIVEFIIKLIGLGRRVFYTKWNYLDLSFAIVSAIDLMMEFFFFKLMNDHALVVIWMQVILLAIRLCKLFRFVKIVIPAVVAFCDNKMNKQLQKSYEVLRGLIIAEEDVLRVMDFIFRSEVGDNDYLNMDKIHEEQTEFRNAHKTNRICAIRDLCRLTFDHRKIMSSVKTKQALKYLSQCLKRKIDHWYSVAEIDDRQYATLMASVEDSEIDALTKIRSSVSSPGMNEVLASLFWVRVGGMAVIETLTNSIIMSTAKEGDILCEQGSLGHEAMYIVINGILKVTITASSGEIVMEEYFGTGSFLGEMSLLTNEPRSGTISAFTDTQFCVVTMETLEEIFEQFPKVRLELIRSYCVRKAYTDILVRDPAYQDWTESRMKHTIAGGQFIDLLDSSWSEGYRKKTEDYFIILIRGACVVDTTDDVPPLTKVLIRTKERAVVLPTNCHKIMPPSGEHIPKDRNVWLFTMPRPDHHLLHPDVAATTAAAEVIQIEHHRYPHSYEAAIPREQSDLDLHLDFTQGSSSATSLLQRRMTAIPVVLQNGTLDAKTDNKAIMRREGSAHSLLNNYGVRKLSLPGSGFRRNTVVHYNNSQRLALPTAIIEQAEA